MDVKVCSETALSLKTGKTRWLFLAVLPCLIECEVQQHFAISGKTFGSDYLHINTTGRNTWPNFSTFHCSYTPYASYICQDVNLVYLFNWDFFSVNGCSKKLSMSFKVYITHLWSKTTINNFSPAGRAISPTQFQWASGESACNVKGLLIQLPTS